MSRDLLPVSSEIQVEPQRPDINVETIKQAVPAKISQNQLPWITSSELEIPLVRVLTTDGVAFRYGSAVKGNGSIERLADKVEVPKSVSAEQVMFKSLPMLFEGRMAPNIDRDTNTDAAWPIFKVSKKGADAPRLFFTWFSDEQGPVVVKLAIAQHKKQQELIGILRNTSNRRKRDGRGR